MIKSKSLAWLIVLPLLLLTSGCYELSGAKKARDKFESERVQVIELHAGADECVASPAHVMSHRGSFIQFYAVNDDASFDFEPDSVVVGMGQSKTKIKVNNPGTGWILSPSGDPASSGSADAQWLSRKYRIAPNAERGRYYIKVSCGGHPDDPPVVDVW